MSEIVSSDPMGLGERRAVFGPQIEPELFQEVHDRLLEAQLKGYREARCVQEVRSALWGDIAEMIQEGRAERLALIRLLRDETNSSSVHARCVAIVGEGS